MYAETILNREEVSMLYTLKEIVQAIEEAGLGPKDAIKVEGELRSLYGSDPSLELAYMKGMLDGAEKAYENARKILNS